jgi:hypothetical protein
MQVRENEKAAIQQISAPNLPTDRNDPFAYFAKVIRGEIKMATYDLSSPGNNEIVMQILEAAKSSVKTGKTIVWDQFYRNK